jgi:hypothetical protein
VPWSVTMVPVTWDISCPMNCAVTIHHLQVDIPYRPIEARLTSLCLLCENCDKLLSISWFSYMLEKEQTLLPAISQERAKLFFGLFHEICSNQIILIPKRHWYTVPRRALPLGNAIEPLLYRFQGDQSLGIWIFSGEHTCMRNVPKDVYLW